MLNGLARSLFKLNLNNPVPVTRMLSSSKSLASHTSLQALDEQTKRNFGIQIVPNQQVRVVERFGTYLKTLTAGIHMLIPGIDKVKYVHSLKEQMLPVDPQMAWTKDNIQVSINGNIFVQVEDPHKASYNVAQPYSMIFQMAYALMRREVALLDFDELLNNRNDINAKITGEIKPRIVPWGLKLLGYEIQNIKPQNEILEDLTRQSTAERKRREAVNESEGARQVKINTAEGYKRAVELESEGKRIHIANIAEGEAQATRLKAQAQADATANIAAGEAQALRLKAEAQADAIRIIGEALRDNPEAARFDVAQKMIGAWDTLANKSPTLILSKDPSNVKDLVAQAFATYQHVNQHVISEKKINPKP